MFEDTTGSMVGVDDTGDDGVVVTIVAHPDLSRIGDCVTLDARALLLGIGRTLPEFTSPLGGRLPLGARRVSRTPFSFELRPSMWPGGDDV